MKQMCAQLEVLEKIRKKGKVNGYSIDLAEAQAKDFVLLSKRVDAIETKVEDVQRVQVEHGTKLDLIIQRLNSPVEEERLHGAYWRAFQVIIKSPKTWIAFIILVFLIAMTGQEIKQLLGWIPATVG